MLHFLARKTPKIRPSCGRLRDHGNYRKPNDGYGMSPGWAMDASLREREPLTDRRNKSRLGARFDGRTRAGYLRYFLLLETSGTSEESGTPNLEQAIAKIGSVFNSQRMMRRYTTEAYVRH
jgi:hypothetical protein